MYETDQEERGTYIYKARYGESRIVMEQRREKEEGVMRFVTVTILLSFFLLFFFFFSLQSFFDNCRRQHPLPLRCVSSVTARRTMIED